MIGLLEGTLAPSAVHGAEAATVSQRPTGAPQRVVLGEAEALAAGDQVLVRWNSLLEAGVLAYDLYRWDGGQRSKVNPEPVVAVNTIAGGQYSVLDGSASPQTVQRYEWEARLITGESVSLGRRDLPARSAIDPVGLSPQTSETRLRGTPAPVAETAVRPSLAGPATQVDLPSSTAAVKIRTTATGLHFLSANNLATLLSQDAATVAGWISSGTLAMSNQGEPVVYIPGATGSGAGLFFYAEANRNNYTYENVYWLRGGSQSVTTVDGGNPDPPSDPGSYVAVYERETDSIAINSLSHDPEEDFWMWQGLPAGTAFDTWTAPTFQLRNLVRGSGLSGTLRLNLYGGSQTPHLVRAELNGTTLGEQSWSGMGARSLDFTVPSTVLRDGALSEGNNTLVVQAKLDTGVTVSQVYVDSFRLSYTRSYQATSTRNLEAGADGKTVVSARGFLSTAITVYDVTNPKSPKPLNNLRIDRPATDYRASFNANPSGRYVVFEPGWVLASTSVTAAFLSLVYPSDLLDPATRASYVVVTPAALLDSAQQLAAYRSSTMRTKVIPLDEIYHNFSHGLVTPHAIKAFVKHAYLNWALPIHFLALMGDGTFDYRNLQGMNDNLMPPLMIDTDFGLYTSDSLFGDVFDDGQMRVSIGRLPLTSNTEMSHILAKIQSYESEVVGSPLKALLIADRPDAAGDFVANIIAVEGYLSPSYTSEKVYPEPYPVPSNPPPIDVAAMRAAIQDGLNLGTEAINYIGHGSVDRFGSSGYLVSADVPSLANAHRLPIAAAMTCVAGQYSSPGFECLAEALMMGKSLNGQGVGSIASVAPTGLSYDDDAHWINRRMMELLERNRTDRLGDVVRQTFAIYNAGGPRLTPVWMYNLLGDPALRILATLP